MQEKTTQNYETAATAFLIGMLALFMVSVTLVAGNHLKHRHTVPTEQTASK
jgi:hypothetical protein